MQRGHHALIIEASPAGPDLLTTITQRGRADGALRLWWLGQAGFALRYGETLLLIDPYLSDSLAEKYRGKPLAHERLHPVPVAPARLRGCAWYLCTHAHTDHMDSATIQGVLQASAPSFLIPRAERERGRERGIPAGRLHTINAGESRPLSDGIAVEAIAAAHERLETDAEGNHRFLGYIISAGGLRIYHSGDCVPYPGLDELLATEEIDLALLPINGRDPQRLAAGIPGNFTLGEAIDLCAVAGIGHLLGHHFELFSFNTVERSHAENILRRYAGSLCWTLPRLGTTYALRAG